MNPIESARAVIAQGLSTCGHTVVDRDGMEQPCGRPSVGWRWYQDLVEHEDCLGQACAWHENTGGILIAGLIGPRTCRARRTNAVTSALKTIRGVACRSRGYRRPAGIPIRRGQVRGTGMGPRGRPPFRRRVRGPGCPAEDGSVLALRCCSVSVATSP